MATVLTGQDLALTIDSTVFDVQTLSTSLTIEDNREVFETLDGPVYKTLQQPYALEVTMLSDWGTTGSLCEALASAALTAPDTSLTATLVVTGANATTTATFKVFPTVPPMTGAGTTQSETTVTLTGDRNTAPTIVAA